MSSTALGQLHQLQSYAALDAARDYMRVGLARSFATVHQCLFEGPKGQGMEDVAPHLFESDVCGQIAELILAPDKEGEFGILLDATVGFGAVRQHLRRFLLVRRARDTKKVLFRYYDPRVLRAFLPACSEVELMDFFGPIREFHCQGDEPGVVLTFSLRQGSLRSSKTDWQSFLGDHFPERRKLLKGLSKQHQ